MSRKRKLLHTASISLLTVPNLIYLGFNVQVLKEANAIALTMTAMLVLAIVGLGALAHIKADKGIWVTLIGIFILSLSNIAYIAGIALVIEGGGLAVDGYFLKPLILKEKERELEANGKSVTYTREIK